MIEAEQMLDTSEPATVSTTRRDQISEAKKEDSMQAGTETVSQTCRFKSDAPTSNSGKHASNESHLETAVPGDKASRSDTISRPDTRNLTTKAQNEG